MADRQLIRPLALVPAERLQRSAARGRQFANHRGQRHLGRAIGRT